MMATHRALVAYQRPDGVLVRMDSEVDYDGQPNWKFRPLDPKARENWEVETAQPGRVASERGRQWHLTCLRPLGASDPLAGPA
jgi:hypothetical protein